MTKFIPDQPIVAPHGRDPMVSTPLRSAFASSKRIQDAVLKRIGDQGAMPIRIHYRTLADILNHCGLHQHADNVACCDRAFYEIEAVALEALVLLARWPRSAGDPA